MDIKSYDPKTRELIDSINEKKRTMSEDIFDLLGQLLEIAVEKDDYLLQGFAHYNMADALFAYEKDYSEFRDHLAKSIYYFGFTDEKLLLARAYNFVAIDALNNGSYDVAYFYLMNAIQTCEDLEDDYLLSIINNNIGQLFGRMGS